MKRPARAQSPCRKSNREELQFYGVIAASPGNLARWGENVLRLNDMIEKPKPGQAPSNLGVSGRYVLPPEIFDYLDETKPGTGGEIQLTDGLRALAAKEGLWAHIHQGKTYDAGNKLGFLKATVDLALQNPTFRQRIPRVFEGTEAVTSGIFVGQRRSATTSRPQFQDVLHFFFFAVPFSLEDFASLDFDSVDFESLAFDSAGFESVDLSGDFAELPSPEPSPAAPNSCPCNPLHTIPNL